MATSLQQIKSFLDEVSMNYREDDNVIFSGLGNDGENVALFFRAREDGGIFEMQAEPLNDDNSQYNLDMNHPHTSLVMQYILRSNYQTKFGTWELNHKDGDLHFAVEIPLEDAVMTSKQFKRILSILSEVIDAQKAIKYIVEHGEFPSKKTDDVDSALMAEFAEFLRMKKAAQSGSSSDGI